MNAIAKTGQTSALMDPNTFDQMQRVGRMLAMSPLFPEHLRKGDKDTAIANGVLVMNMAHRLNEDPLTVAQNIYFVGAKPGWSSSYMISKANQHGVFENPIDWEVTGQGDSLSVTAFAVVKATKRKVRVTCDMAMAKAEGWTKNAKYKSMPEQMLRYRSATFLIRLYCPEVMVGVPSQVEVELEMKDVTPEEAAHNVAAAQDRKDESQEAEDAEIVSEEADAKVSEPEPEGEEAEREEAKEEADPQKHKMTFSHIESDLGDGAGVEATRQFHAEAIELMKAEAPEIHAELEELFAGYENPKATEDSAPNGIS